MTARMERGLVEVREEGGRVMWVLGGIGGGLEGCDEDEDGGGDGA